eukprot:PhF_6_TR4837/c0_g1_i1/m.6732
MGCASTKSTAKTPTSTTEFPENPLSPHDNDKSSDNSTTTKTVEPFNTDTWIARRDTKFLWTLRYPPDWVVSHKTTDKSFETFFTGSKSNTDTLSLRISGQVCSMMNETRDALKLSSEDSTVLSERGTFLEVPNSYHFIQEKPMRGYTVRVEGYRIRSPWNPSMVYEIVWGTPTESWPSYGPILTAVVSSFRLLMC